MLEGDEYRWDERAAAGRQAAATEQIPEIDQNVVIKRGWAAYDGLRFQEAESCFGGLLHGSDASPIAAVCGLSAVKRALGRPSEAKCLVERARQYHVDDTFLRRELGYIAYDQRCFDGAASIFADLAEKCSCVEDLRWRVASLRRARNYRDAAAALTAAHEAGFDHPDLEVERGWVAYGRRQFKLAVEHFTHAQEHGALPDIVVPPLVTALLRLDRPDAAEDVAAKATGDGPPSSPIACALADIQVHRGCPENAIYLLWELKGALDDQGLRQLVTLLIGADRDTDAVERFDTWFCERCGDGDHALAFASPPIVATSIDVAGRRQDLKPDEFCAQVHSTLDLYDGPDPVPAVVAASAICTLRTVDKDDAMRIARASVAKHPQEADLLIESAKTSFVRHQYKEAIETLDDVIELDQHNDRALQWRCRSMRRLGQWPQLENRLKEEIGSHEQYARLRIELGWLLLAKGDYGGAYCAFSTALGLDKSSQQARFGRISALRRMQRWQDASADLETWKREWPHSRRRRLAEAMLAMDREDFHGALDLFAEVDDVSGLLGEVAVLMQQGNTHDAMARLVEAEKKDPDRPGAKIALAMLLVQRAEEGRQPDEDLRGRNEEDWDRASKLCVKAMDRGAESDAAALACRAQLAVDQGYPRAAESLLREAIQHNPYATRAASALAAVLVSMHRIDDAVKMLNEQVEKYGPDSSAQFQLYRALLIRGDRKAALAALRTALGLATGPERDTLAVALAYELEEQGCSAEAERLLRNQLATRSTAGDDLLRLGLAWILLSRGDRAQSPALLQEAVAEASQVIVHPDPMSASVHPEKIRDEAFKCRGTAYYKLAEHERRPVDRIIFATSARHDQGEMNAAKSKVPPGARWLARLTAGFDTGLRMITLIVALTLTVVLWVLHGSDQGVWTTTMVMSLTPLFFAVVLLTALLPQLQSLKLAGLEAHTRESPDVPLPTSPCVVLPQVTEFAAVAHESFLDTVDVSDLGGTSSTPRLDPQARDPSPAARGG